MAAERGNMEILKECNVFEQGGSFRLNLANCKRKKIHTLIIPGIGENFKMASN